MQNNENITRYLAYLEDERNSALIYSALAEQEGNPKLAEFYKRLAKTEQSHAETWINRIQSEGGNVPPFRPAWRTRVLLWLARRFGPNAILPTLIGAEANADQGYAEDAQDFAAVERSHARTLSQIGKATEGGMEGSLVAQVEGRHRTAGGNALRAAVLGANDGLVSNFSLVMGVAGAELTNTAILVTGLAGLLAGAISMALGEWISVGAGFNLPGARPE
jgi:rubrerythrin